MFHPLLRRQLQRCRLDSPSAASTEPWLQLLERVSKAYGEADDERLIEIGPHHLTYETVDGPLPVADHRSTLSCVAEPGGCHLYWSAYFVPTGPDAHLADGIVGAFYEIGLRAIAERFGAPSEELPGAQAS